MHCVNRKYHDSKISVPICRFLIDFVKPPMIKRIRIFSMHFIFQFPSFCIFLFLHTTKIIIAQRVNSVEHADRIIVMENGRINAFDTHENLLKTNDIYREIYETQTGGGSGDFDQPAPDTEGGEGV